MARRFSGLEGVFVGSVVRVSATDLRDLDALVARIRRALQAHA